MGVVCGAAGGAAGAVGVSAVGVNTNGGAGAGGIALDVASGWQVQMVPLQVLLLLMVLHMVPLQVLLVLVLQNHMLVQTHVDTTGWSKHRSTDLEYSGSGSSNLVLNERDPLR